MPVSSKQAITQVAPLLPLRALSIRLAFTAKASFGFFHHAAIHAFIRTLLGSPDNFDSLIMLDAPESGRSDYSYQDEYCFTVYGLSGSETLIAQLINKLIKLPHSCTVKDSDAPLRDNTRLIHIKDLFTDKVITDFDDLSVYENKNLQTELDFWQAQSHVTLRILSPFRILKDSKLRKGLKGELRFCRNNTDLKPALLFQRLEDTWREQLKKRGNDLASNLQKTKPQKDTAPAKISFKNKNLFWVDSEYYDKNQNEKPLGGMMGIVTLNIADLDEYQLMQLVFGQTLALGQMRAFGLGRYQLESTKTPESEQNQFRLKLTKAAKTITQHAAKTNNTFDAYERIRDNASSDNRPPKLNKQQVNLQNTHEALEEDWWKAHYPDMPDPDEQEQLADKLERLSKNLKNNSYEAPYLKGIVIKEHDGDLRGLAIPPFWDRVTQRAITQQITPALDKLMYSRSYGYRKGLSRITASHDIQRAYREGYRYVYEADIEDYFDNIKWDHLHTRLKALYRDDPVIDLIMNWIASSVDYQGFKIERQQGLPQGAPISPVMANIMLDDFDDDIASAGFRLIRYADDFVILCKKQSQIEQAAKIVQSSLAELDLELNPKKTGEVSFEQGFKFLGYLFMNDMVIDIGGKKGDKAKAIKQPSAPPPNSWMAKLGNRYPVVIDEFTSALPAISTTISTTQTKANATKKKHNLKLGERKDGTLLILSGKNTLITTKDGHLIATRDDKEVANLALNGLSAVLLLGNHHITTPAIRSALKAKVPIHFASRSGKYQGVTWNGQAGSEGITLWQQQNEIFSDPTLVLRPARKIIMARIRHMREVLRQRNPVAFYNERRILQNSSESAGKANDLKSLNGVEGNATRAYFSALKTIIPEEYGFTGRNRRPPKDPFNSLLSLGYTYLYSHLETMLRIDGFYPWKGLYHQSHGRHAALASDLMEPFRHIVERTALKMLVNQQLKPEEFTLDPEKGCRLSPNALRLYFSELYKSFDTPVKAIGSNPNTQAITPLEHIHQQNLRLNTWLRGGETFKPWIWR